MTLMFPNAHQYYEFNVFIKHIEVFSKNIQCLNVHIN